MAFDGFVISNVVHELKTTLCGGRIYKIYQPETDEIILIIKNKPETHKLFLSADASLPLIYLTTKNKTNPMQAPNFCMLLRKHILNGRITDIKQLGLDRIIEIDIEHLNELGDICMKKLIIEIMGKHSNIIFTDSENMILDSIKHISNQISSVREVLPGRTYVLPPGQQKENPLSFSYDYLRDTVMEKPLPIGKAIYTSFTGISPLLANEICHRANVDSSASTQSLNEEKKREIYEVMNDFSHLVEEHKYHPNIIYNGITPVEFSCFYLSCYDDLEEKEFSSISEVLEIYYAKKNQLTLIRQKSADLRKIVSTALERTSKKYDLQLNQLKSTEKRDKYKVYGELLNVYGYNLEEGADKLTCLNYYTNEEITIPLDKTLTAQENSQKYFSRYNKLKRTYEALSTLTLETKAELEHLESIMTSLDIALEEEDLVQLKEELIQYGYIKKRGKNKKREKVTSKPFHYISSDGFHMYVGKNNFQNEELTFKFANGKDMWFHAKGMAGSHVIVKLEKASELPDRTYEEAGRLAAYYSKGRQAPKVEIDYTERKNLKKPPNAKPGFVIYHTNYSLLIEPDISKISLAE